MKKTRHYYLAAIIQTALVIIAVPVARAEEPTTDGYVTRKEYDELKAQLLAMKKELDALKNERAVTPKRESSESHTVAATAPKQESPGSQSVPDAYKQVAPEVPIVQAE